MVYTLCAIKGTVSNVEKKESSFIHAVLTIGLCAYFLVDGNRESCPLGLPR